MMNNNIVYYIEAKSYSIEKVPQYFIERNYFAKNTDNEYTAKVCGITSFENKYYVFFPKNFDLDYYNYKSKSDLAKLIFVTLKNYKNTVKLDDDEKNWLGSENQATHFIDDIEWLIDDYIKNGKYIERNLENEVNGKGRIDWSNTIKNKSPYIINQKLYYLDLLTNRSSHDPTDTITLIHENIIKECFKNYGWLFNRQESIHIKKINMSTEKKIHLLKDRLSQVFTDRKKKLILSLIKYLEYKRSNDSKFILLTPYFYNIWEEMLKYIFSHNKTIQNIVPKPYWKIGNIKKPSIQIPDILVEIEKEVVILDAKYYAYDISNTKNTTLPGWDSIVKQLYYNLSLKDSFTIKANIFIFPKSLPSRYSYIGITSVDKREEEFGYVYTYSIDIVFLMKLYSSSLKNKNLLLDILEDIDSRNLNELGQKASEN